MIAYSIDYMVKDKTYTTSIDAKNLESAKKKIGRKHGYKTGRMVKVTKVVVIGYF